MPGFRAPTKPHRGAGKERRPGYGPERTGSVGGHGAHNGPPGRGSPDRIRIATRFPDFTAADVDQAVHVILEHLTESLTQDERIEIRGFGVFTVRIRPAKIGRNPRTGEPVGMPVMQHLYFKAGLELARMVDVYD